MRSAGRSVRLICPRRSLTSLRECTFPEPMQRPMAFAPHPRRWWKTPPFVALGLLTALACSVVSAEDRYAFLVGVENYDPTELPSLTYAEDDIVE